MTEKDQLKIEITPAQITNMVEEWFLSLCPAEWEDMDKMTAADMVIVGLKQLDEVSLQFLLISTLGHKPPHQILMKLIGAAIAVCCGSIAVHDRHSFEAMQNEVTATFLKLQQRRRSVKNQTPSGD